MRILSIIHMTGHVPHKTTKEKIFYAARVLFARKGFAATLTREIAAEAGVNLALINYYFKSKENLYHIITIDNLKRFRQTMIGVVNDHTTTLDEKLNGLTANYINLFLEQPDLPLFLVNEVGKYPKEFITHMGQSATFSRSAFYKANVRCDEERKNPHCGSTARHAEYRESGNFSFRRGSATPASFQSETSRI